MRPLLIHAILAAALLVAGGCAVSAPEAARSDQRHPYLRTLDAYLDARARGDTGEAERHLAPDARIWFDEKTGPGRPKTLRGGWGAWDIEMNAVTVCRNPRVEGDTLVAEFHEMNDYARLLDHPGWWSQSTYWFDDQGRISEQLYQPSPTTPNPSMDDYREPMLEWARANRAEELDEIHPIEPSTESARRWRALLIEWRRATGRLPID